jgi:hypothetical protein
MVKSVLNRKDRYICVHLIQIGAQVGTTQVGTNDIFLLEVLRRDRLRADNATKSETIMLSTVRTFWQAGSRNICKNTLMTVSIYGFPLQCI